MQFRPIVGHVENNIRRHLELTRLAVRHNARLVMFPELSLTGYEPVRAAELARVANDPCFNELQSTANGLGVTIAAGVPLQAKGLPTISTLLFRPNAKRLVYSKMFLHPDEEPFFQPGMNSPILILDEPPIAMAICFEIAIPQHANRARNAGATSYVASVAKTAPGVVNASQRLSEIAAENSMSVLMANCLGVQDGSEYSGQSSAWDRNGNLVAQLDNVHEGLIVVDVASCEVVAVVNQ